jgi:hypothetical protein
LEVLHVLHIHRERLHTTFSQQRALSLALNPETNFLSAAFSLQTLSNGCWCFYPWWQTDNVQGKASAFGRFERVAKGTTIAANVFGIEEGQPSFTRSKFILTNFLAFLSCFKISPAFEFDVKLPAGIRWQSPFVDFPTQSTRHRIKQRQRSNRCRGRNTQSKNSHTIWAAGSRWRKFSMLSAPRELLFFKEEIVVIVFNLFFLFHIQLPTDNDDKHRVCKVLQRWGFVGF